VKKREKTEELSLSKKFFEEEKIEKK